MTSGLPDRAVRALAGAGSLVVLTGAGMSAESGVPTFRGPGGLWEGFRAEDLATPQAFDRDPERVWRWYHWRGERVARAEPHAGHFVLRELESEGFREFAIVTQNVDGLHQRAGSTDVVELHGSLLRAHCPACGRNEVAAEVDPRAPQCGCGRGVLRPSVVWFGEALPGAVLARAESLLKSAEMVWVVGTSSVVYPAAGLPERAAARGAVVIEVNPDPTPLTPQVDGSLRAPASAGLATLARLRRKLRGETRL